MAFAGCGSGSPTQLWHKDTRLLHSAGIHNFFRDFFHVDLFIPFHVFFSFIFLPLFCGLPRLCAVSGHTHTNIAFIYIFFIALIASAIYGASDNFHIVLANGKKHETQFIYIFKRQQIGRPAAVTTWSCSPLDARHARLCLQPTALSLYLTYARSP